MGGIVTCVRLGVASVDVLWTSVCIVILCGLSVGYGESSLQEHPEQAGTILRGARLGGSLRSGIVSCWGGGGWLW